MTNHARYGRLRHLAQQVCQAYPETTDRIWLCDEMLRQAGEEQFTRNSCYKALTYHTQESARNQAQPAVVAVVTTPEPIMRIVTDEQDSSPWCVTDNHYSWESKRGSFWRTVSEVDEMFYSYSRHGLNLTQVQMIHDFGLSLWEWNTLKQKLLLQKESNVFSPWTVSQTPLDELAEMVEAKVSRRYEKQGPLIERAVHNAAVKQLNKVLAEQSQREARMQALALELSDLLPEVKYRYIARAPQSPYGPEHLVFTIADPHVLANVKQLLNSPVYNKVVLFQYAEQLAARVNARGAANVYLAGLGDYIESFTGMNHPNSWLQMDQGKKGAQAIKSALEFFTYLIERIHNIKEIWGVSGNHDRTSSNKKEDSRGEAAELLFMFLQERYERHGIQVIYKYDLLVRVVDNICYILGHSHLGMLANEKKASETIARHRVPGYYCVLLSAHLHTRIVKLDSDDCRWVFAPSLFTGNDYSSENGYSSLAGFLTIENNGFNLPIITDLPLSAGAFAHARQAA